MPSEIIKVESSKEFQFYLDYTCPKDGTIDVLYLSTRASVWGKGFVSFPYFEEEDDPELRKMVKRCFIDCPPEIYFFPIFARFSPRKHEFTNATKAPVADIADCEVEDEEKIAFLEQLILEYPDVELAGDELALVCGLEPELDVGKEEAELLAHLTAEEIEQEFDGLQLTNFALGKKKVYATTYLADLTPGEAEHQFDELDLDLGWIDHEEVVESTELAPEAGQPKEPAPDVIPSETIAQPKAKSPVVNNVIESELVVEADQPKGKVPELITLSSDSEDGDETEKENVPLYPIFRLGDAPFKRKMPEGPSRGRAVRRKLFKKSDK